MSSEFKSKKRTTKLNPILPHYLEREKEELPLKYIEDKLRELKIRLRGLRLQEGCFPDNPSNISFRTRNRYIINEIIYLNKLLSKKQEIENG